MSRFSFHLACLIFAIALGIRGFAAVGADSPLSVGLDEKAVLDLAAKTDDPRAQMQAGWFYLAQKWDGKKAQEYLEKALTLDSNCAMAYAGLGLYYEMMGDQSRAIYNYALAAQNQPDWAMGGAMLHRMAQLVPINSAGDFLAQTCQTIIDSPGVDLRLQDFATFLLASTLLDKGDRDESQALFHELGFVDQWQILGPIPAEGRSSLIPIPEVESYPLAFDSFKIANDEFQWRLLPFGTENGEVPLTELLSPMDASAAYAVTSVEMQNETRVRMLYGGPGLNRVWVDGNLVLSEDEERTTRPDQVVREFKLGKGRHFVLVKTVCRDAGGDLNFALRFTDTFGRRIIPAARADIAVLDLSQPRTTAQALDIAPTEAPWDITLNPEQDDPLQSFWKGNLAERYLPAGSSDNLAWQLMNQSLVQLPDFLPGHMATGWASSVLDRQDAEYDIVLNREPRAVGALLLRAKNLLNRHQQNIALNLFSQVNLAVPENVEALYYLGYIYYQRGLWDRVHQLLETNALDTRNFYFLNYLDDLAMAQINTRARRIDDYLQTLAQSPTHSYYRLRLVDMLEARGMVEQELELLRQGIELTPYDEELYQDYIEALWGNQRVAEARLAIQNYLEIFPNSPRLNELAGLMAEKAGDVELAKGYYQRVLELSPQNQTVSERLDSLSPPQDDYYRPYKVNAADIITPPIPPELLKQAQAIVLLNQDVHRLNHDGTSRITRHQVIKILDEEGAQMNNTQGILFSPDLDKLKVINARVISPDGSEWNTTNYNDRSVSDPNRKLFYNYIYRLYHFPHVSAGMIIDFEYSLESGAEKLYGGAFSDYHVFGAQYPTLQSEYIVIAPKTVQFYEKGYRGVPAPQISERMNGTETVHRYIMRDLPAVPVEDASPPQSELLPEIRISSFGTWEQIGKWYWGLAHDRIKPTPELEKLCSTLMAAAPENGAMIFSSYAASQIRYVGLELGISGYLPRTITEIFSSRYGDCKDKAVLLVTMLGTIGQKADVSLLATNNSSFVVDPDFPTIGIFNHAIVALPKGKDELHFTDPTAEFNGLNELPWSDQGVWALVVDEGNYRLVKIPPYSPAENSDVANTEISLNTDGSAYGHRSLSYGPINSPMQRERFSQPAARQSLLEEFWSYYWAGSKLTNLNFSDTSNLNEPVSISYDVKIPHFSYPTGGIMRLPITLFTRAPGQRWAGTTTRKLPLLLGSPTRIMDNLTYHLPEGAQIEQIPANIDLKTAFGEFHINTTVVGLTVQIEYILQIDKSEIKPEEYADFRNAMLQIDKAETDRLLVRIPH
jgi:cellulose synthase operon protein C